MHVTAPPPQAPRSLRRTAFGLATALACAAALIPASAGAAAPKPSAVIGWNTFASNLVAANLAPGPQTHALAVSQIAVHDALNAIRPRYAPYAFAGSAPRASAAAAVAAAERDTLDALVPQAAASVDATYVTALSTVPDGARQGRRDRDGEAGRGRDPRAPQLRRPPGGDHEAIHAGGPRPGRRISRPRRSAS